VYQSDRDIRWAIEKGLLIVDPISKIDPTSIDLHLDSIDQAKVWDVDKLRRDLAKSGVKEAEVHLGDFHYAQFAAEYNTSPPEYKPGCTDKVCRRGHQILVRPGGFLLWQTKEKVGTPEVSPQFICFVDGKSTRARTGIVVHLTAPTIHAGWWGKVVLEIANLGPLTFVLKEDDVIAQLTVARISSVPEQTHADAGTHTMGQIDPAGTPSA
jgi:deoxycytidine triphosphate deaminase